MFPLNLEKQNEQFFAKSFAKYAKRVQGELLQAIRAEFRADAARFDSIGELIAFIEALKQKYGDRIDTVTMAAILKNNYRMIDAWARNIVNEELKSQISDIISVSQIAAISMADIPGITDTIITQAVTRSLESYTALLVEYHNRVTQTVLTAVREGHSYNTIASNIQRVTGTSYNQAKFYGRDLASSAMAEIARERQTRAGFQGYEWRTVRDSRVRDSHINNHGNRYSWNTGAGNLSKPGARHPGDDYNCRCYAKPVRDLSVKPIKQTVPDKIIRRGHTEIPELAISSNPGRDKVLDSATSNLKKMFKITKPPDLKAISKYRRIHFTKAVTSLDAVKMKRSLLGSYSPGEGRIRINNKYQNRSTVVHEWAHMLDLEYFGSRGNFGKRALLRKWKKAVINTQTFKDNKALSKTDDYAEYLIEDEELWARSFEQYVARITTSNKMKKDFYIKKRRDTDIQRYWNNDEFELIHREIDDIMKSEGIFRHGN